MSLPWSTSTEAACRSTALPEEELHLYAEETDPHFADVAAGIGWPESE